MLNKLINILFPPKCIFCKNILEEKFRLDICPACYSRIPFYKGKIPLPGDSNIDGIICVCEYTGIVKDALRRYKFFEKSCYYRALSQLLADKIKGMTGQNKFDIILSVPIHKSREIDRGYNQSLLISSCLSKELNIPERSPLLKRIKNTKPQSSLKKDQRYYNVKDAFVLKDTHCFSGKDILIVDDIFTTGNTLSECCRILKMAGARSTTAAVIATGRNNKLWRD